MKNVVRFLICLCLLPFYVVAQKHSTAAKPVASEPEKLLSLKVTGSAIYTDKEVLGAAGLRIGQNVTDGDFREAVRLLGDSGMFSNVAYSFNSSGSGVKLEMQLADIDLGKLVPVEFDNFAWFTETELRDELRHRVPLLHQTLPLTGNLPDHVSEALQAMLTEKKLPGRVDYLREGDMSGGPVHGIVYRVEEVSFRIHGFEFPGASDEQTALLRSAAKGYLGHDYGRNSLYSVAKLDLLPVYLQHGYLKAHFGPSEARAFVQPTAASADGDAEAGIQVDAVMPVTPGPVYSTAGVDWKGNNAITIKEIAPLLHLPNGQPTDAVRLLHDLDNIAKLYHNRGYMMAEVKADPKFDDEHNTVHYDVNIVEGDLYKMGELEILGLDTQTKARMQLAWTLAAGEPYNADYLKKFIADAEELLPRDVRWAVSSHATPDTRDKTVDVEVRFKQQ